MKHEAFYSTTATVIPVLYIFIALTPSQWRAITVWPETCSPMRSTLVGLPGFSTIVLALFGEVFAISELMENRDDSASRIFIFATLLLLLVRALVSLAGAKGSFDKSKTGASEL
jgi:hypothetical protein